MMPDEKRTAEHTIPQWLHKLTGTAKSDASFFGVNGQKQPTWEQLALESHAECNRTFGERLERKARSPIKKIIEGGSLHIEELEIVLDFLDKVLSTVSHTANAFSGHKKLPKHDILHFPDYRVGAVDRVAIFFKVSQPTTNLEIFDPFCEGFIYTPSAVAIRVCDVVMISISSTDLLSPAFGLQYVTRSADGSIDLEAGRQQWSEGFGWRTSRITAGLTIAQPMRRMQNRVFPAQINQALKSNGDGLIFQLKHNQWQKKSNIDFSTLPTLSFELGMALALLETYEWLLLLKELDNIRMPPGPRTFMRSVQELKIYKQNLISIISYFSAGLGRPYSDRPTVRSPNLPMLWP